MQQTFSLAGLLINPAELTISNSELQVSVQLKPMEVLVYLAQHYPTLVSREQLIDNVWLGNNYVGEKALTNAIWQLRNILQKFNAADLITTIRKKGYRLAEAPQYNATISENTNQGSTKQRSWRKVWFGLMFIIAAIVILAGQHWVFSEKSLAAPVISKITNSVGRAFFPALSPDGRYLVFTWRKLSTPSDLYLIDLQDANYTPKQLTFSSNDESSALWSKDNRTIFYSSKTEVYGECHIMRLDTLTLATTEIATCGRHSKVYMDESVDGRYLVYSGKVAPDGTNVYLLDLQNTEAEPKLLPCHANCQYRVREVAFSPDGQYLALTRRAHRLSEDIYLLNLATNEEEKLTEDQEDILGVSWHPDSKRLVYASVLHGKRQAFMFNLTDKQHYNLDIDNFAEPSKIAANGDVYFFSSTYVPQLGYLPVNQGIPAAIVRLTTADERYEHPNYSHAKKAIAYVSNESGNMEIWMSDPDMVQRTQLTQLNGMVKYPQWSYDGRFIAFVGRLPEQQNDKLMLLEVATGKLSQLATGVSWHGQLSWWYDDSAIIYSYNNNLFKFELKTNAVSQLTTNGGVWAQMPAKDQFYFSKGRNRGLWQLLPDQTEKMLLPSHIFSARIAWAYANNGIYFLQQQSQKMLLSFYNIKTSTTQDMMLLPLDMLSLLTVMSYDPDNNRLFLELPMQPRADIYKLSHPLLQ
ncbi:winged helix-turn-helix domain-containing protein [Rheinheimera metallidurans]|uniref:winged helix-turn-helix domain-containing protein n=1 Tax=Rheinheimera metallidurans TaxID=2925781 RepID=UPI0030015BEC